MNTKIRFKRFATALEFKYTPTDKADMPASGTLTRKLVKVIWSTQTVVNTEAGWSMELKMVMAAMFGRNILPIPVMATSILVVGKME